MVTFRWVAASLCGVRLHLRQRSVNHGTEVYNERVLQVRLLGGVAADHDGEQLSLLPPVSRLLAVLALGADRRFGAVERELADSEQLFGAPVGYERLPTSAPETWLLRVGWARHGAIGVGDRRRSEES